VETAAFTVLWVSLALYALLAGADFGVGVWVLWSFFTNRGEALRRDAFGYFGPVWEINTLFLVFFIVGLVTAFPRAIGVLGKALIPLVLLALVLFVVRAAAYALLHYGPERGRRRATWAFALSSVLAGMGLGYAAAAPASGYITGDSLPGGFYTSALALAALPLALLASAHLSALVIAAYGAARDSDATEWFRRAALVSSVAVFPFVVLFTIAMVNDVPYTSDRLKEGGHWVPMVAGAILVGLGTVALLKRRYGRAALLTFAGYLSGLLGGAFAQLPYLVYPSLTLHEATSGSTATTAYLVATGVGAPLLLAAMLVLYHLTLGPRVRAGGTGQASK
jgi:cytochrome d ubiquinol oxidase subunit II